MLPVGVHGAGYPCRARALFKTLTPTTYLLIALAALISVCRCMRAGAGWSMLSKVSVAWAWARVCVFMDARSCVSKVSV